MFLCVLIAKYAVLFIICLSKYNLYHVLTVFMLSTMFYSRFVLCLLIGGARSHWIFPKGFKFGAATSSYQIEGAWNASDKSESIWDKFTHHTPGAIRHGHTGDVACNSYHLWKEDIQMAVDIGLDHYRFSISWPRLLPTGFLNVISEDGKKYYSDLIDGLLEKGIQPMVTIYHWDLPQRLQDMGGWTNPLIIDWFVDYARTVFSLYGDRVKTWLTLNEPLVMCDLTYNTGMVAPGIKDPEMANYICLRHVMLAHAKAWRIYDEEFKGKYHGKVALVNALLWIEPEDPEDPVDQKLADLANEFGSGLYTHPIYSEEGGWPPVIEKIIKEQSLKEGFEKSKLPAFTKEEIEIIKGTYDFFALNFYTSRTVRQRGEGETQKVWPLTGAPVLNASFDKRPEWLAANEIFFIYPEGLRRQLADLKKRFGDIEIVITENGFPSSDRDLNDEARIKCIRDHLEQILISINEDKVNVTGYTVWSLMDNLEWMHGYTTKFGLYDVDFSSPLRTRTPRASAKYFKSVIESRTLKETSRLSDEL